MTNELADKVTEIVESAGRADSIEAVEVLWAGSGRNRLLRIFIDKPGGVTHADCEMISQQVSSVLDSQDIVPGGSYTLEVSSPGVERKLTKPKDFERFLGQKIKLVLRQPVENRKVWDGALAAFDGSVVTLQPDGRDPIGFPLDQVERANLKFEW